MESVKVSTFPEADTEVPLPFRIHWLFWIDPAPGVSGPAHAVLASFNSEIALDGRW